MFHIYVTISENWLMNKLLYTPCDGFSVETNFKLLWVDKNMVAGSYRKSMFTDCPAVTVAVLCHSGFSAEMNEKPFLFGILSSIYSSQCHADQTGGLVSAINAFYH